MQFKGIIMSKKIIILNGKPEKSRKHNGINGGILRKGQKKPEILWQNFL